MVKIPISIILIFFLNNILDIEPNTYFFKDIAEYRNCYYKGSEKSWLAYSWTLKRFLKYCFIDMRNGI